MNIKQYKELDELIEFCGKHEELYIYGARKNQQKIREYLQLYGIVVKGFVVSPGHFVEANDVYELTSIKKIRDLEKVGFIVGTLDIYYNAILQELFKEGVSINNVHLLSERNKETMLRGIVKKNTLQNIDIINRPSIDSYFSFYTYVKQKCKKGQYNLLCHVHLGDTLVCLGLKEEFEKKYQKPIHYLISESQEVLAYMYGITNYTVIDFKKLIDDLQFQNEYSAFDIDRYKDNLCQCLFPAVPQLDNPFIASASTWIIERLGWKNFVDSWAKMLGLSIEKINPPLNKPKLSRQLEEQIHLIEEFDKIVLLAPEAQSFNFVSKNFWIKLSERLKLQGFTIITNTLSDKNHIEGTYNLKMSLSDLLAVGYRCHSVYSSRSGLCDCLAGRGNSLYVYYIPEIDREYFSLNNCFKLLSPVNEMGIIDNVV